ncbi:TetR family transcriptional regulator [Betaproteobacteria bacterium]|nr:TetR family transcriptional regulator [Betaproteobacteria bacterium]
MSEKRQTILEVAQRLFRDHGYRAIGVDRVQAEAGVAKMTLYKYFPSKDDLIATVLEERDRSLRASMDAFVANGEPAQRLRSVFKWHGNWFGEATFNGCMFINAVAEFPQPYHPARLVALAHKERMRASLEAILADMLPPDTALRLAMQFMQILDGATVAAQFSEKSDAAALAWRSAADLLRIEGVALDDVL